MRAVKALFKLTMVAAAAFFLASPVMAQECTTEAQTESVMRENYPQAVMVDRLVGDRAADFRERINSMPPPSDWAADTITVWIHPAFRTAITLWFVDGCLTATPEVSHELLFQLLSSRGVILASAGCTNGQMPADELVEVIIARAGGAVVAEITGEDLEWFMDNYNSLPPTSNYQPERMLVMAKQGGDAVILLIEQGGCVVAGGPMPIPVFQQLLRTPIPLVSFRI